MATTKITRYGNSLAVRLPAALVKDLGMREGDNVMIRRSGSRLLIERATLGSLDEMLATVQAPEAELGAGVAIGAEDFE
jgi:antitoxin MazE